MRYLMADKVDGFRMPQFVAAGAPLARSLLDALANVVYIFQDNLDQRTAEFIRRGFAEDHRRAKAHRAHYGGNPAWIEYVNELRGEVDRVKALLGMTDEEANSLRRFPTLGAMIKGKNQVTNDERRRFLEFLNEWFYGEYSQDAHLSAPGLYRRSELLMTNPSKWTEKEQDKFITVRGGILMTGIVLMLAIASEIDSELSLGVRPRLLALWNRLSHNSLMIWDTYRRRYRAMLAKP